LTLEHKRSLKGVIGCLKKDGEKDTTAGNGG
jgi:hypothetical protein